MPDPSIFTSVINSYLPEPHASLLNGILFGISLKTSKLFFEQLKMVGLLHIVVLSGINITLLASIIAGFTSFLNKKFSVFISIFFIILFVFFVGPKPPIVRAAIMGVLTLLAVVYGRQKQALYFLFLSALIISMVNFEWVKTVSFQLSFAATFGIILFGGVKKTARTPIEILIYALYRELKPSLAAQIFTTPIIFLYFKQVSFIAPLSNLLVSPLISPLIVFGFLTAILGKINYFLGLIPSYICYGILNYMIAVIEGLSKLPFIFLNLNN